MSDLYMDYDIIQSPRALRARWELSRRTEKQDREEIRSGVIIRHPKLPVFTIEAGTAKGHRWFQYALEVRGNDAQSEQDLVEDYGKEFGSANVSGVKIYYYWPFTKSLTSDEERTTPQGIWARKTQCTEIGATLPRAEQGEELPKPTHPPSSCKTSSTADIDDLKDLNPEDVLLRLESNSLSPTERRQLVIEAEVVLFEVTQKFRLRNVLLKFIEQNRNSQDREDLVAVGSAIRKLVANLPNDDTATAATLLDAEHRATPPIEVELEVAKSIVRRLAAQAATDDTSQLTSLADGLMDLARTYLHNRLLSREKHAAVALNAVLALLLLNGNGHQQEVIDRLKGLSQRWFTELLARRAIRLREEVLRRQAPGEDRSFTALDEVIRLFANPPKSSGSLHASTTS